MTVTIVVLDSVGMGALPDAADFSDAGSHTLNHTLEHTPRDLPNLAALGLGNISEVTTVPPVSNPVGSWGRLTERSLGKDTTTGHWEFMGILTTEPFQTFPEFPAAVMDDFSERIGRGYLANHAASGTVVIADYDEEHRRTGFPIVYTSADSVFQVAAHTDVVPLEMLYEWCEIARELLVGEYAVARVIARPYTGRPGDLQRLNDARRDYATEPPERTVLDALAQAGKDVVGVGKIPDIFAHRSFTAEHHSGSNDEGVSVTKRLMAARPDGLIFTNLVDFDALYGHRRNPEGYADALQAFDQRLPELLEAVGPDDLLLIVSDHGNDPTWAGTDHTREYGLLLAYTPQGASTALGDRASFADVGATVCGWLGVDWNGLGTNMTNQIKTGSAG